MTDTLDRSSQRESGQTGFALLSLVVALISLALLLIFGLEERLRASIAEQQQRKQLLQEFGATNAALGLALHLRWERVTPWWQCQSSTEVEICLRASGTSPQIALLRARSTTPRGPTLYRLVSAQKKRPLTSSGSKGETEMAGQLSTGCGDRASPASRAEANKLSNYTIHWVPCGWFDSCPEPDASLCN